MHCDPRHNRQQLGLDELQKTIACALQILLQKANCQQFAKWLRLFCSKKPMHSRDNRYCCGTAFSNLVHVSLADEILEGAVELFVALVVLEAVGDVPVVFVQHLNLVISQFACLRNGDSCPFRSSFGSGFNPSSFGGSIGRWPTIGDKLAVANGAFSFLLGDVLCLLLSTLVLTLAFLRTVFRLYSPFSLSLSTVLRMLVYRFSRLITSSFFSKTNSRLSLNYLTISNA